MNEKECSIAMMDILIQVPKQVIIELCKILKDYERKGGGNIQYEYFKQRLGELERRYITLKNADIRCTKIKDLMFIIIEIGDQTECICLNNEF